MSNKHRIAGRVLAMLCAQVAGAAFGADFLSREDITAAKAADAEACHGAPLVIEEQKLGRTLAFVRTPIFWKDNNKCTDNADGESIGIYERVGDNYRLLRMHGFDLVRAISPSFFSYRVSTAPDQSPEAMVAIELHQSGSGHFLDYEIYRLTADSLERVEIKTPATIVARHLRKNQRVIDSGMDFTDDRITFSMVIMNPGETNRHATGGSALGEMKLVRAAGGLDLVPVPESLQLPRESDRLNGLGIAAYREKRYAVAADYYRQALNWNRRNYEASSNLALVYLRQDNLNEAIRLSLEVLHASEAPPPIQASAAYNLGLAHESKGERDRAMEFYSAAVRLRDTPERRAAVERLRADGVDSVR